MTNLASQRLSKKSVRVAAPTTCRRSLVHNHAYLKSGRRVGVGCNCSSCHEGPDDSSASFGLIFRMNSLTFLRPGPSCPSTADSPESPVPLHLGAPPQFAWSDEGDGPAESPGVRGDVLLEFVETCVAADVSTSRSGAPSLHTRRDIQSSCTSFWAWVPIAYVVFLHHARVTRWLA